ncbi:MAG TPA: glycosyltransferase family 4 protein [Alphaproteobacteria bacterium]|nr:glycosyltransferase family 4 protein [Alphaproteobacteria bacterium]
MDNLGKSSRQSLQDLPVALVANTSWYLYKYRGSTIRALRERGAQVICIAPTDATSANLTDELGAEHVPIALSFDGYNPFRELRSFVRLTVILARYRPDFVFNFTIKANIYSGIACRLLRLPYANNITGLGMAFASNGLRARLIGFLSGLTSRGAARVFVQNPDDLALMKQRRWLDHTPVTQLPGSGVDLERFTAQPPTPPPLTFVMIARLQGNKGVREFMSAARQLRSRRPEIRFVLVGSNEHTNHSAIDDQELSAWRAEGVVRIPGPTADVRPWLTDSHALVMPSYGGEGMPRVVLEAAACARPALVSDVPGCRHAVVDGRTGYMFAPRSAGALAEAMEMFAALPAEKRNEMGRAARVLAEERFSERIAIDAYIDCVASLAASSSNAR